MDVLIVKEVLELNTLNAAKSVASGSCSGVCVCVCFPLKVFTVLKVKLHS